MPWDGCHQERKKRTKRSQRSWVRAMPRAGAAPPRPPRVPGGDGATALPRQSMGVAGRVSAIEAFGDGSARFPVGSQCSPSRGLALSWGGVGGTVGLCSGGGVGGCGTLASWSPGCCRGRCHPGTHGAAAVELPRSPPCSEPPHTPNDLPRVTPRAAGGDWGGNAAPQHPLRGALH